MSRIDEALRRAAGMDAPIALQAPEESAVDEHDSILERFPGERSVGGLRTSTGPPPTETAAPQRRPAASPRVTAAHSAATQADRLGAAAAAAQGKLIVNGYGFKESLAANQYRRVAAALHELQVSRGLKTVMVTSALPQEGKTLTVANLALTLSDSYARRVLLIDADLRRPALHTLLGVANGIGLTEALASERGELPLVDVSSHLAVLTSGRPDVHPLAGLTSERMRALLAQAAARFDWVLLDTPPVALLPDAPLLAGLTDAVILVIRAGSTAYPIVERVVGELGRERIVGTVLNRVDERAVPETSYYDHYR